MDIPGMIDIAQFNDERGTVSFPFDATIRNRLSFHLCQINEGYSEKAYTMHGLHFQTEPYAQAKLVRVLHGSIYNVAVDIRVNSETFGTYYACTLDASQAKAIYIPKGFAHGYLSLFDHTLMQWLVDEDYHAEAARCLSYKDPKVSIPWPVADEKILVSKKDQNGLSLEEVARL